MHQEIHIRIARQCISCTCPTFHLQALHGLATLQYWMSWWSIRTAWIIRPENQKRMKRKESANWFIGTKLLRLVDKSQLLSRKGWHTQPEGPPGEQHTTQRLKIRNLQIRGPSRLTWWIGGRCTWIVGGTRRGLWHGPTTEDSTEFRSAVCQPERRTWRRRRIVGSPTGPRRWPQTVAGGWSRRSCM